MLIIVGGIYSWYLDRENSFVSKKYFYFPLPVLIPVVFVLFINIFLNFEGLQYTLENYYLSFIILTGFTKGLGVVIEEIVFRVIILQKFLRYKLSSNERVNNLIMIVLSSIVFGLMHLFNLFICIKSKSY